MKTHFPKIHAEWEMQWMRSLLLHTRPRIGRHASIAERFDANEPNQPNWPREWMELLLANGADPNERDRKGDTPLHAGILERNEEAARLLVAHGVDVKARNLAGSTILHYAASEGLTEVISLLLTKGVDVNAQDNDDDTPLHGSGPSGPHESAVELLLGRRSGPKDSEQPQPHAARRSGPTGPHRGSWTLEGETMTSIAERDLTRRRWVYVVLAVLLLVGGCKKKRGYRSEWDLCWPADEGDVQKGSVVD